MGRKVLAIMIAVILISSSLGLAFLFLNRDDPSDFIIEGNEELLEFSHKNGFNGAGTADDPIILEDISLSIKRNDTAFSISNTTLHLVIQNLKVIGEPVETGYQTKSVGLSMMNASNISIIEANITDCKNVLSLRSCHSILVGGSYLRSYDCRFWGGDWPCSLNVSHTSGLTVQNSVCNGRMLIKGCENGNIFDNQIGSGTDALVLMDSSNISVQRNSMSAWYSACALVRSQDIRGSNNSLQSHMGGTLFLQGSIRCNLSHTEVSCTTSTCIIIEGSEGIGIEHTNSSSPIGRTLELRLSRGIDIVDLTERNGFDALLMEGCSDCTLRDMVFSTSQYYFTITDCDNCTFLDIFVAGTAHGFNFVRCSSCLFQGNVVTGNVGSYWYGTDYVIALKGCHAMTICNNIFIVDVPPQPFMSLAYDDTIGNDWNDTASGNVWSNWNGTGPYPIAGNAGAFDLRPSV